MGNPAKDAQILIEAGQSFQPFVALADQGDHQTFLSNDELWSDADGKSATVRPNGIINGGIVTPAASGARANLGMVHARTSFGPAVKNVSRPSNR